MKASEVIKRYETYCPQEFSMEGDNRGLQIGTLDKDIQKVMVALDIREDTVAEAIEKGVDLIIVKHAPIFRPIKDLVASRPQNQIYIDLIKHDIAVYVSHTNIDIVENGLMTGSANYWILRIQLFYRKQVLNVASGVLAILNLKRLKNLLVMLRKYLV